jgi:hypothetical protein
MRRKKALMSMMKHRNRRKSYQQRRNGWKDLIDQFDLGDLDEYGERAGTVVSEVTRGRRSA